MSKEDINILPETENIEVIGARVHNLKNIDVSIPRDKLTVITGLSGSGKSSLAFDTIYAEGQRRYLETFSSYARSFLGGLERPEVDKITGLSPVIAIEQKTVSKNPRSTVGTITEIYDFYRLLYARAGTAFSKVTGEKMVKYSEDQIVQLIQENYNNKAISILAPVVKGRKGHYRELFEQIRKQGFVKARVDGEFIDVEGEIRLDRYKIHDIEIVIDRIKVGDNEQRLKKSIATAFKHGKGSIMIVEKGKEKPRHFSRSLMCPTSGISYDDPAPNLFSFNSPYGACSTCNGLGTVSEIDQKKIIPDDSKSIKKGAIAPVAELKNNWITKVLEGLVKSHGYSETSALKDIDQEVINKILYGTEESFDYEPSKGVTQTMNQFEGIVNYVARYSSESTSPAVRRWANSFMNKVPCPTCGGSRLKEDALYFKIDNKNIFEVASMDINSLSEWMKDIEKRLDKKQKIIAKEVLKEIRNRLGFLVDVGLTYLSLNRSSRSLSGGEAQRIRLATQIGTQLVGVLYILDEPSIGLHQRDNQRLIDSLKKLRDTGNTILVVEHDMDMMIQADHVVDIGPKAGINGGYLMASESSKSFIKNGSITSKYISGELKIEVPKQRRKGSGKTLTLKGASGNNLKNVTAQFPLGKMICVTGVSGSGKSTLINQTLYPILNAHIYNGVKKPLDYKTITGLEHIDKVIDIDQSPIGRTPRSNPATYTGVFTDIRSLFANMPESKIRGYKPGRFSFNVKGGRCETCKGAGVRTIEMNFLPDVFVECETCQGKRYNRETLEVRYKGHSISDVLNLTINNAVPFFEHIPNIYTKLKALQDVGLGYITLGQSSVTLSGGEAQRVKLASELYKKQTGKTFYILDEPSTGLHFEDIKVLLGVLNRLADQGNTVLIIEHNLDIIKVADHIIDIGPEGGENGGSIVSKGTPEEIVKKQKGITWEFLKNEI